MQTMDIQMRGGAGAVCREVGGISVSERPMAHTAVHGSNINICDAGSSMQG